jgi:predicted nucleic acid-binding protein
VSTRKRVVLDANILIRAFFGEQVISLLNSYEDSVEFYTPDFCLVEAKKHVPRIAARGKVDPFLAELFLDRLFPGLIQLVDRSLYEQFEERAQARISTRDPDDWPIVATALLLDAPIWTEDQDFFGCGIPTWTTNKIELYLRDA